MILGIGTDIVDIERVRRAAKKPGSSFMNRVFTQAEQDYFESLRGAAESIAGGFAAKEAVAKALGTGFNGMTLRDIEVLHDELGKPCVQLHGGAQERFTALCGARIHLSITHEKQYAAAFAIAED